MAIICKNIYKNNREYYRKKKACHGRHEGMFEWQPMKRFLFFSYPTIQKAFLSWTIMVLSPLRQ